MSQARAVTQSEIVQQNPLAHPTATSVQLFDYSLPPGDHLKEFYNALWKAVDPDFPHATTKVARLLPRGHGKSEAAGVVFPTWAILTNPQIRVAVISKTADLATERTAKVVDILETYAPAFGIELETPVPDTELETAANDHKEPTLSGYGLESNLTGKHFDIIVWDDIAEWDNQRTETQRQNVREYFRDYTKNLLDPDSVLECGGVQAMIGTRKHPEDIYATDILDSATWDVKIATAIAEEDWPLVEERAWSVRGDDGQLYDSVADLPADVNLANDGVLPERDVTVCWPDHKPAESLLYDIVDGDDSTAIWRRENQQDPHALSGEVFKSDWLVYVDELPKPASSYNWYGGMDIGVIEDLQEAAENNGDFSAVAAVADDKAADQSFLVALERDRGLSVKANADWAADFFADVQADYGIEFQEVRVETNKSPGVYQRLRDDTSYRTRGVSSTESKEGRIHDLGAEFESTDLKIVGDPLDETWRSWEQKEWLQFPNAAHDDRLDAIELAMQAVDRGGEVTNHGSMRDLL